MRQEQKIRGFYEDILKAERLPSVPLVFCWVGRGGACVQYVGSKPLSVQIDTNRCMDFEYAILHEIAHVRMLFLGKGGGHHRAFIKEQNRLIDKYAYSSISLKHFAS